MNSGETSLAKWLIITGAVVMAAGIILWLIGQFSSEGKLPGDIVIKKKNFTFYFPLATSIVVSLLLTALFFLISKFRR